MTVKYIYLQIFKCSTRVNVLSYIQPLVTKLEIRSRTLWHTGWHRLTESSWRKAQVFHPRSHQGVEFLPLRAPEQRQSLLADPLRRAARTPLGRAGAPTPLPAQPPGPLHALPPEQGVVWGVGRGGDGLRGGGVTMSTGPGQQGLPGLSGVLVVFHRDGHLGLWRTNITAYSHTNAHKRLIPLCCVHPDITLIFIKSVSDFSKWRGINTSLSY